MPVRPLATLLIAAAALLVGGCADRGAAAPLHEAIACQSGAWRMDTGEILSLSPVEGGLRYRLLDGRSGRFEATGGDAPLSAREGWREQGPMVAAATFGPCSAGRMRFRIEGGPSGAAEKIALPIRQTRFRSGDLALRGRLVLPADSEGPVPLAVLVHGSERYSAIDAHPLQYLLPAQGVAVFVYDKRGTGGSGGEYTQDFRVLAGDAIAALEEALRLAPGGFSRTGYVGGSQGGWIAPLAASRSSVDYAVAMFGLAEGALAEDREQVMNDLRAAGHGEDVLAKAREVTDATALLMASGFTRGFDELDAVRRAYGDEAWFGDIRGEFTGRILQFPAWTPRWAARWIAMRYDVGTSWDYEPLPVLAGLATPQLWIIAAEDREAPNAETVRRLRALQAQGRPIDLVVFPDTDHGIYEFAEEDGERILLRHPEGYLRLLADWIVEPVLQGRYGTARLEPASTVERPDVSSPQ